MTEAESRRTIGGPLRLAAHARLDASDSKAVTLVLASGEMVRLNLAAAQILALCDGTRTAAQIAAAYGRTREEATLDFVTAAIDLGWIRTPGERGRA